MVHWSKSCAKFAVFDALSIVFVEALDKESHIIIWKLHSLTKIGADKLNDFLIVDYSLSWLINKPKSINCVIFSSFINKLLFLFFNLLFQITCLLQHEFQINQFLVHNFVLYFVHFRVSISAFKWTIWATFFTFVFVTELGSTLIKTWSIAWVVWGLADSTLSIIHILHRRTLTHMLTIINFFFALLLHSRPWISKT